ncbi:chromosome partitioning protein [Ekhidna lutea]|uniref:Chromosome partitioning protein n=1 Tax=Ekhidna lutea TaxID=447679 RepID=A0A239H4R0_EKHLU|nr:ParA family protein [Ekhidna lutea]SNS75244.1 chromosome partitioning protein [Ekhidna lutea]
MIVYSIINHKGGTGKTTTAINLGAALKRRAKDVLLIDLDPQGNLSYSLGVNEFSQSMADALLGECSLGDVMEIREGITVAPSDNNLADTELSLARSEGQEKVLSQMLTDAKGFDFVLIDCPPSLSTLTLNALLAADKVIIPMQMEVLSLQGLDQIVDTINKVQTSYDKDLSIEGVLPVMVDKRRKLSIEVEDYIKENYDLRIFKSHIRNNVKASEAPSFGKSVISYKPTSNSAVDYMHFADEILELNV